ncbi:hypothetical protein GF389_01090 [Candidatus Dojkabacteria bacterium]|nr:hypothetical protein [Candidatus Dojkabacteria bacterium]
MNLDKSKPIIITAGGVYADIDVLACALALKQLYTLNGIKSEIVLGRLNASVPKFIKKEKLDFKLKFKGDSSEYNFSIVDISNYNAIVDFVDLDSVVELYDHHFGFEEYWEQKLGDKAIIEPVGSCATLVWEQFKKEKKTDKISKLNARLLGYAIISNTLNFNASVTTQRDKQALQEIIEYADYEENWKETYFNSVSEFILADPVSALKDDSYTIKIGREEFAIGQLELWDAKDLLDKSEAEIVNFLESYKLVDYFLTVPSISEGRNYLLVGSDKVKSLLEKLLGAEFQGNMGKTNQLYLRKEMLRDLKKELT